MFDRLVSLFSDCFLEIKWGENKEPTGERVVLNNSNFSYGKPREHAFIFSQGSLSQPLVGKVRRQLTDGCCSDFLNVQPIRFAATSRTGVHGDQTRRQTMKSHNINCELKAIYKAWRHAPASVLHTAVSKHITAVFSSALRNRWLRAQLVAPICFPINELEPSSFTEITHI